MEVILTKISIREKILKISLLKLGIIIVFYGLLVSLLEQLYSFKGFAVNILSLSIITFLCIYYLKFYYNASDHLIKTLSSYQSERILVRSIIEVNKNNYLYPLVGLIIGIYYTFAIVNLSSYDVNITYIAGAILMIVASMLSLTLYFHYLKYQRVIYILSNMRIKINPLNIYIEKDLEWFDLLASINNKLKNGFLLLGMLLTFQYAFVIVNGGFKINCVSELWENKYFLLSWLIIFIFIFLGFTVFNIISRIFLLKIKKNINKTYRNNIDTIFNSEYDNMKKSGYANVSFVSELFSNLNKKENLTLFPIYNIRSVLSTNAMYLLTLLTHFGTLYVSFVK